MDRDVTAHDAWTMRQHGMVPPDHAPRYEDPRVATICKRLNELHREMDKLDEELALLARIDHRKPPDAP